MEIIGAVVALLVAIIAWSAYRKKKRRQSLLEKYNDEEIVDRIMKGTIWQGMTQDQLIDSWGEPAAKDNRVFKTKVAETFKYGQTGKNRFRSRVKVENGFVVGWEQK